MNSDCNTLFIERALQSLVMDQIRELGKHVGTHTIDVHYGTPNFTADDITAVRCRFFPMVEPIKGALFVGTAMKAADELCASREFHLLHAHFGYPDGLAAFKIGRRHGLPYVVSVLGDDLLLYPQRNRYLRRSIATVMANAAAVIGVSLHLLDTAVAFGADRQRCHHIPDGIRPEVFHLATDAPHDRAPTILFAGAFLPVKNVLRMIDAFAIVQRERPDVRFMLAGDGPLREAMEQRSADAGLTQTVEFVGHVTQPQLAGLMQQSSVLCLPSVSEGWPNVIVEALACGCPVVGSAVGGMPEQIVSEDYGYLCNPQSTADIAEKILNALDRDWDRQALAARGSTWQRGDMMKQIADVYRQVLPS